MEIKILSNMIVKRKVTKMSLKRGMGVVNDAMAKLNNQNRDYSKGLTTKFLSWGDIEAKVVRFLTPADDIIFVDIHEFVQSHDGKKRSYVCRENFGQECELCARPFGSKQTPETMRREVGYGVVVLREPKFTKDEETGRNVRVMAGSDENRYPEHRDAIVEYELDGKDAKAPYVAIINQGIRFWGQIATHSSRMDDQGLSLPDRDFEIIRMGKGTQTTYSVIPAYGKAIDDLGKYNQYLPDIEGLLRRMGSQEYYDRYLHGIEPVKDANKTSNVSSSPTSSVSNSWEDDDDEYEDDVTIGEDTYGEKLKSELNV
jgi:hypothetical protein